MTQTTRPKLVHTEMFYRALVDAGVLREDETIKRIVIDADAGAAVVMYIERWADTRLLDVSMTLDGIEIRGVPAEDA